MSRIVLVALFAAAFGAAVGAVLPGLGDGPAAKPDREPEVASGVTTAALQEELQRVHARLDALRPPAGGPVSASDTPSDTAARPVADEPAPIPDPPLGTHEIDAELAMRLDREQPDPEWSGGAEALIRDAVATLDETSRLLEVECRSTLCRAELAYASTDAREHFLEVAPAHLAFAETGVVVLDGSPEDPRAVLYLGRQGAAFPRL